MIDENLLKTELARRVKYFRKKNKLSQNKLGKIIGVTQKTIARLEDPDFLWMPSLSSIIKVANALNLSLEVLFTGF